MRLDDLVRWVLSAFLVTAMLPLLQAEAASTVASPSEPPVPIPHPTTMLLRAEAVHADLALGRDQVRQAKTLVEAVELPLWRLRNAPPEERNPAARALLQSLRTRLSSILTLRQLDRLDELIVQALGVQALLEPRVAATLDISAGQKTRLHAAFRAVAEKANRIPTTQAGAVQKILALLTQSQRQTLAGLMGEPFDFTRVPRIACRAPELTGVSEWVNTSPLTLEQLRGKVVALHFYAFGCINCVRNLPHYDAWHEDFAGEDFVVLGIHRPETQTERNIEKVRRKASEAGMDYPIAIDNESHNWDAWVNGVWPSVYLIDKNGFVRYWWYGELNWQGTPGEQWMRQRITELLAEPAGGRAGTG